MRGPALLAGAVLAAFAGSIGAQRVTAAWAEPAPFAGQNDPYTRYDGPVSVCRSDPSWKPGVVYVTLPCDGQSCFEGGVWICHLRPDQTPAARAAAAAERRRAADAYKNIVDAEVVRLGGEYRRPEAERLVKMRMDAEAARRRAQPGLGAGNPAPIIGQPPQPPAPPKPPEMCTVPASTPTMSSNYFANKALAAADVRKRLVNACSGSGGRNTSGTMAGPMQCRTLPSVTYANGKREPSSECQVRYSCPAYQAPCAGKGGGKPASARGA